MRAIVPWILICLLGLSAVPASFGRTRPKSDDDSATSDSADTPKQELKLDSSASDDTTPPPRPLPKKHARRKLKSTDSIPVGAAAEEPVRKRARKVVAEEPEAPQEAPQVEGKDHSIRVRVNRGAKIRAVNFTLQGEERTVVEDQGSATFNSIVNIGRGKAISVGFEGEKFTEKNKSQDMAALFYVFSGVEALKEFEVTISFMKKGDELIDSGKTADIFRVEAIELARIGDTDGKILKQVDHLAFDIGQKNRVPLNVRVAADTKVGVRLSIPREALGSEELYVQIKAARKGKFPVQLLRGADLSADKANVVYSPDVSFVYVPRAGDMDTFTNPAEGLAAQINRYLESHPGDEGEVEIPLKVKVDYR